MKYCMVHFNGYGVLHWNLKVNGFYSYISGVILGDLEQERYFFSNKEAKYPNGNRVNRTTASGYWKATGLDKQIVSSSRNNNVEGMKKTLVFYKGKPPHGSRTDWVMHEYRLVPEETIACNFPETNNSAQVHNCYLIWF